MIKNIFLLLVAILPVYLIGLYIYSKDKDKESKKLLAKLFFYGIISCIPALGLEFLIGSFFGDESQLNFVTSFFYILCSIAIIEELCKWFFVYKIAYNNREFDHIYDAIVYSVFLSLGFAALENVIYIFNGGFKIAFLRAISAVPGHACYAIAMGNYLGIAKMNYFINNKSLEKKNLLYSIFVPSILHGLYDYCLFTGNFIFLLIFLFLLVVIYVYGVKTVRKVSSVSSNFINSTDSLCLFKFCPNCGVEGIGKFCINCGSSLEKK